MQYLGLIAFIILIIGLTFTAIVMPGDLSKTFSQRVANNKRAEILYSLLFMITLPLLYLFFATWLVPAKALSQYFLLFAAIAATFQILCTWVPERGGTMTVIHRTLTGISGVALLPMVLLIATVSNISPVMIFMSWIVLILMIILLAIGLVNQKGFKYALLLQVGYYVLFVAVILLVTYVH
jgi:hypothetical protein